MNRPAPEEFNPFYATYIKMVPDDVMDELHRQADNFPNFIKKIPSEKADFAYTADKWTIKEVIGHIIDAERIMAYRALRFARNDSTDLPGFDENKYAAEADYSGRDLESLANEFASLRKANLFMFNSFSEAELKRQGKANGNPVSVRALLFIIAGHLKHHQRVLSERYL